MAAISPISTIVQQTTRKMGSSLDQEQVTQGPALLELHQRQFLFHPPRPHQQQPQCPPQQPWHQLPCHRPQPPQQQPPPRQQRPQSHPCQCQQQLVLLHFQTLFPILVRKAPLYASTLCCTVGV